MKAEELRPELHGVTLAKASNALGLQFPTLYNDQVGLDDLCSLPAGRSRIVEIH